jgi:CheY-like chemotaxis protein
MASKKFSEILLVDDDPITNYLNEDFISGFGLSERIVTKENGREALKYVEENWVNPVYATQPKLILLDINMPVMDGFGFLEHFFRLPVEEVSIFLLTTSENIKDLEKARKYRISGYLNKPLEVNHDFIRRIGN